MNRRGAALPRAANWLGNLALPGAPTQTGPTPTIQINSLNPSSGAHGTSIQVAVLGVNLLPGDTIVWDGGSVATNYIYSGQVTCDSVVLGPTPRGVPVHLLRPSTSEISNDLTFTVT